MKNVLVGTVTAALLGAGLVGGTAGTAAASCASMSACDPSTVVSVVVPKAVGKRSLVKAKVIRMSSSTVSQGRMVLTAVGAKGAAAEQEVELVARKRVDEDGKARFAVRFPQAGRYRYAVEYKPAADSGETYAVTYGSFRVKRK